MKNHFPTGKTTEVAVGTTSVINPSPTCCWSEGCFVGGLGDMYRWGSWSRVSLWFLVTCAVVVLGDMCRCGSWCRVSLVFFVTCFVGVLGDMCRCGSW